MVITGFFTFQCRIHLPVPGFQCHQQDVTGDVVLPSSEIQGKFLLLHLQMIEVAALLLLNFFCRIHLNMPKQISEMNIENGTVTNESLTMDIIIFNNVSKTGLLLKHNYTKHSVNVIYFYVYFSTCIIMICMCTCVYTSLNNSQTESCSNGMISWRMKTATCIHNL